MYAQGIKKKFPGVPRDPRLLAEHAYLHAYGVHYTLQKKDCWRRQLHLRDAVHNYTFTENMYICWPCRIF
jgi:hypothetical protein